MAKQSVFEETPPTYQFDIPQEISSLVINEPSQPQQTQDIQPQQTQLQQTQPQQTQSKNMLSMVEL